jgi:hypothetical protein
LRSASANAASWPAFRTKPGRTAFSAAGCWAQAGNFYQAIAWCDDLLAQAELPDPLRRRVASYVQKLRARRARWYAELVTASEP